MRKTNIDKLQKIPEILEVREIALTRKIKELLGEKLTKIAVKNSRSFFVYRIVYKSQGHKVVGYIIEPKIKKDSLPCIIWNRGGSGDFGAIKIGQLFVSNIAEFAKAEYI